MLATIFDIEFGAGKYRLIQRFELFGFYTYTVVADFDNNELITALERNAHGTMNLSAVGIVETVQKNIFHNGLKYVFRDTFRGDSAVDIPGYIYIHFGPEVIYYDILFNDGHFVINAVKDLRITYSQTILQYFYESFIYFDNAVILLPLRKQCNDIHCVEDEVRINLTYH